MNAHWVDTHCHLQLDERSSKSLISEANALSGFVVPGVDVKSSIAALELAREYPGQVGATVGLHPHDTGDWESTVTELESLVDGAVAVGETGLDYYRDHAPREKQRQSFRWHLELAVSRDLPVVIHCRDAFSDVFSLLEEGEVGNRAVLHCWTGGRKWTRRFLELGVMFSFAGPLTFTTGETIRLAAELVPPHRALVETDTPYLAPEPHRGETNCPAWVVYTGAELARIWGMPVDNVAAITTDNAARVFGIPG